ncbi:F-type H+-transporting ATPase subunit epsilon [Dysgonomonadaceae bacterium PH5-43]|nr:F-type H+-transporting ATPase subunit epsilon [Dysgonomonadaceae bacterium PH5-43]
MRLEIISPEKIIYIGEAEMVSLPGLKGSFTILERHAPIISSLSKGKVVYRKDAQEYSCEINGGFIEMKDNKITVCVE